ncbi:uncharacterized protein ASCRUDRAFT_8845 [Ascoidea rubescens DSM 1968]|uniref:Uncharacterized protein n=1 Tax=Ascoidea rubescens DSM 1968 TaxID=1344418 RepID=A0A1D2VEJ6_9ASCO|nr:hypothetical protein ASCRUDRAFT_8845 [Ascoidea rubescens DSM 1968]ODV60071.1 hypothetical protein ASCRUDRAFT_8845 [Ascoidea rubescens DSM 1968]
MFTTTTPLIGDFAKPRIDAKTISDLEGTNFSARSTLLNGYENVSVLLEVAASRSFRIHQKDIGSIDGEKDIADDNDVPSKNSIQTAVDPDPDADENTGAESDENQLVESG